MKENSEIDSLWHLPEAVSLQEAACLVAGYDPTAFAKCKDDDLIYENFPKYNPVIRALTHAVRHGNIETDIVWIPEYDER